MGVKTLDKARKLEAKYIRDKFDEYYAINHKLFTTVTDGIICMGDPITLIAENRHANIPIMAGCTADEFPSSKILQSILNLSPNFTNRLLRPSITEQKKS